MAFVNFEGIGRAACTHAYTDILKYVACRGKEEINPRKARGEQITSITTYGLITAATIFNGILAGGNIDRGLAQMPAWRKVGARAWAAYSRHADLENGFYLYPTEAIGGALFTIVAAVSFQFDITAPAQAALPVYLPVALVLGGLLATVKAAPLMMSLRRIGDDTSALQSAFDGFRLWGNVRGAFQILAFLANVWALVAVLTYIH